MFRKIFSTVFISAVLAAAVFADQAAYISQADAVKTAAFLKGKKQVTRYCAPCKTGVTTVIQINTVEAAPSTEKDLWEVKINEEGIDLAYTYYLTDTGKWRNLAIEMGVKVRDVPEYLPEKKDGQ